MSSFILILILLAGVVVTHGMAQTMRGRIALPIVQIAVGAIIGLTTDFGIVLDPELFFVLFLPPLLFLDGWRVPADNFRENAPSVLSLAFGLVFFTVLGVGLLVHVLVPAMPLAVCFALAAVLSPTDVVAAGAMMAHVKVPRRALRILEGEALFNDASGLVCLRMAIAAAMTGVFSFWDAAGALVWTSLGGVAIGAVSTWLVSQTKSWITSRLGEDTSSQILISLLMPYAAYMVADYLGCSAVLAAVTAGIVMSRLEMAGIVLPTTRVRRRTVWDTLQFALNGVIFLLLGEQAPDILSNLSVSMAEDGHRSIWWLAVYVGCVTVALAVLRYIWVWVTATIWLARHRGLTEGRLRPQTRLVVVMSLAGVRGAVTLAAAMSLPLTLPDGSPFPARDLVIFIAAGVIIASLVLANLTLPGLVRGLHLPSERPDNSHEQAARIAAAQAAIAALATAQSGDPALADVFLESETMVAASYQHRIAQLQGEMGIEGETAAEDLSRARIQERSLQLLAIKAERAAIIHMRRTAQISDSVARRMMRETDLAETSLEAASDAG